MHSSTQWERNLPVSHPFRCYQAPSGAPVANAPTAKPALQHHRVSNTADHLVRRVHFGDNHRQQLTPDRLAFHPAPPPPPLANTTSLVAAVAPSALRLSHTHPYQSSGGSWCRRHHVGPSTRYALPWSLLISWEALLAQCLRFMLSKRRHKPLREPAPLTSCPLSTESQLFPGLSSNNPFRNRATSPGIAETSGPPRPASRNPFLDSSSTSVPPQQLSSSPKNMSSTRDATASGQHLTGNAAELFVSYSIQPRFGMYCARFNCYLGPTSAGRATANGLLCIF